MLSGSIDPIGMDIDVLIAQEFSPAARSQALATFAREQLAEAQAANQAALGQVQEHRTTVDGRAGASEDQVRPDGVIAYEFELINDALSFITERLREVAPVRTGRFRDSIELFADGVLVDPSAAIPPAREYVFLSPLPYSRKLEGSAGRPPISRQAPHGVFEATAVLASQRFGNQALIRFSFRAPLGGEILGGMSLGGKAGRASDGRVPAIVVTLRD
jgi:hypothetical protein